MRKHKNKSLALALAVALSATTLLTGATFAWFTAQDEAVNHLETNHLTDGDVTLQEVWDPEDGKDFEPGTEVNKDVGAVNTGDTDAFVRISFEEVLNKLLDGQVQSLPQKATAVNFVYNSDPYVAQQTDISAYAGWLNLAAGTFANVDALFMSTLETNHPGLVVKYKATTTNVPGSTTAQKTTYQIAAYVEIVPAGTDIDGNPIAAVYQKVDLQGVSVTRDDKGTTPTNDDTYDLNLGTIGYQALERDAERTADWTKTPVVTPVFAVGDGTSTIGSPASARLYAEALSETGLTSYLDLIFDGSVILSSDVVSSADLVGKDWYFNVADGWFYYINKDSENNYGRLGSGQSTANPVLTALYLEKEADSSYSYTDFDVTAKMEAIQAVLEALTTPTTGGGWGLVDTSDIYKILAGTFA